MGLAQTIWNKEKRSFAPVSALVQAWGYSGLSGNARTKIAAVRKYELFEENGDGDMRLSDLAMTILHNQPESADRLAALRQAALAPELFAELQQTYPQASDDNLRSYLLTKRGFSDTGADSCIKAFRDTQETARLGDMGSTAIAVQPQVQHIPNPQAGSPKMTPPVPPSHAITDDTTMLRWPLPRGVIAEVRFVGPVRAAHIDVLKQYLDVVKLSMSLDEKERRSESALAILPADSEDQN